MANTSYYLYQKYIKYGSQDFIPVYPAEYAISGGTGQNPVIKQQNDPNCGYHEAIYRWYQEDISEAYICSGGNKYYEEIYQVSYDNGFNWENVVPEQTRQGSIYEYDSPDCIEYRWVNMDISTDWICDDCPELKLKATYSDSTEYYVGCNTSTTLSQTEVRGHTTPYSSMTTAEIGDCVTSIGNVAFYRCSGLTSVVIPNSVTSIVGHAFQWCYSLPSIDIPDSVTSIGEYAFEGCKGLTSCTIGNGVTSISPLTFSHCGNLTSCTIGSGVTSIGNAAFQDCGSLTSIAIPSGVTSIGNAAFEFCSGLTSVNIPSGVTSIGDYAFYYCNGLTSVTVNATVPPTLGSRAFDFTNNCPIYVPAASVNAYKTASGWSTYASRIQAIP